MQGNRKYFWDSILYFLSKIGCKSAYYKVLFDYQILAYNLQFLKLLFRMISIEAVTDNTIISQVKKYLKWVSPTIESQSIVITVD